MKNIHVLPTDKPSRFHTWINNKGLRATLYEQPQLEIPNTAKNIYITDDGEIKEGDWCMEYDDTDKKWLQPYKPTNESWDMVSKANYCRLKGTVKKIILTTDQDLIKDGVQAIPDEFLTWLVKNQSCEEVEVVKEFVDFTVIGKRFKGYKIIIPKEETKQSTKDRILSETPDEVKQRVRDRADSLVKEEPKLGLFEPSRVEMNNVKTFSIAKQETLEQASNKHITEIGYKSDKQYYKFENLIQFGAKWQQEKSYSEEEVEDILENFFYDHVNHQNANIKEWFEQFKKK